MTCMQQVEAEELSDISEEYGVSAVPYFAIIKVKHLHLKICISCIQHVVDLRLPRLLRTSHVAHIAAWSYCMSMAVVHLPQC